ncbi:hypothetical protein AB0M44_03655 [Streptosporangium subroseum]|uniref:hypothetical protein n=1 Tax=Streptosporangium subroseum TaxID=106412 RepID=UPI00342E41AF
MAEHKSPWIWISLVVGGLVAGAVGAVLIMLDLEQADQLASVVGVFIAMAGLSVSVYGVLPARRDIANATSSQATASLPVEGAVTAQGKQSVAVPDNAVVTRARDAGHTTITGAGASRNTIKGGTFHGPVAMGRDISGIPVALPQPAESDASEPRE